MNENRSRFERAVDDVIYSLLYPGVVGSILFDIMDPLRFADTLLPGNSQDLLLLLARLTLATLFIVDYVYLRWVLDKTILRRWWHCLLDAGVATLFTGAYFSLGRASVDPRNIPRDEIIAKWTWWSFFFLTLAFAFIFLYSNPKRAGARPRWLGKAAPLAICCGTLWVLAGPPVRVSPEFITAVANGLCLAAYTIFVSREFAAESALSNG